MNPLLSPTSSLFLPLNHLTPHCNRLQNSLHDDRVGNKERILYEQTLWSEVKKIRSLNDTTIYLYLLGYYHTIFQQASRLPRKSDLFQYHVLIRLGDLNRYMDRTDVAEYYYCSARNLFPQFGHAYNQLGLLTKPTNCYKCCYYYARAARSSEKPLNTIADSNLRIAVSKYDCGILSHILNDESSISLSKSLDSTKLPASAFEWFYVIIVGIYADNIQPIAKSFVSYMIENFSTHKAANIKNNSKTTRVYCDRESYILLACLDVLLDWLNLGSQGKIICALLSSELRQIRSRLRIIVTSSKKADITQSSNNSSNAESTITVLEVSQVASPSLSSTNSTPNDSMQVNTSSCTNSTNSGKFPALPHDYVLRGFSPLGSVHRSLTFSSIVGSHFEEDIDSTATSFRNFIDAPQLVQLANRMIDKIDAFSPVMRKQTRNIALESILSNLDGNNDWIYVYRFSSGKLYHITYHLVYCRLVLLILSPQSASCNRKSCNLLPKGRPSSIKWPTQYGWVTQYHSSTSNIQHSGEL